MKVNRALSQGMKEEVGVAEAEAFEASALTIEGALEAVKAATDGVNNAVLTACYQVNQQTWQWTQAWTWM